MIYHLHVIKSMMQSDNTRRPVHSSNILTVENLAMLKGDCERSTALGPSIFRSLPVNAATSSDFALTRPLINKR